MVSKRVPLAVVAALALGPACMERSASETTALARQQVAGGVEVSDPIELEPAKLASRDDSPIVESATSAAGVHLLLIRGIQPDLSFHLEEVLVSADGTSSEPVDLGLVVDQFTRVHAMHTGSGWLVFVDDHPLVLNEAGVIVATPPDPITPVSDVAWSGDRALVTSPSGTGVFVDAAGATLGAPFTILSGPGNLSDGRVLFGGSAFLVAYVSSRPEALVVASVLPSGPSGISAAVHDGNPNALSTLHAYTAFVTSGSTYFLTYRIPRFGCGYGGGCFPQEDRSRIITVDVSGNINLGPAAAGGQFGAFFANGHYVMFYDELDAAGNEIPQTTEFFDTAAVLNGYGIYSILSNDAAPDGSYPIAFKGPVFTRLGSNEEMLDDPPLVPFSVPQPQVLPTASFDGREFVVAWSDLGRNDARATRVSAQGEVLDKVAVELWSGSQRVGASASNADETLVMGNVDAFDDLARFVLLDQHLAPTAPDLSALATRWSSEQALASNGDRFFLTWQHPVVANPDLPFTTFAAVVDRNGQPLAQISSPEMVGYTPQATYDGQNFVAIRSWPYSGQNYDHTQVFAQRFDQNLNPIDSTPQSILSYPSARGVFRANIASNGSQWLLVWGRDEDDLSSTLRCSRVTRDLELLDGEGLIVASDSQGFFPEGNVAVVWNGSSYFVVFRRSLSGIWGRRLSAQGDFVDSEPFLIAADTTTQNQLPSVAAAEDGRVLVAYQRSDYFGAVSARLLTPSQGGSGGGGGTSGAGGVTGGGGGGGAADLGGAGGGGGAAAGGVSGAGGGETAGSTGAGSGGTSGSTGVPGAGGSAGTGIAGAGAEGGVGESATGGQGGEIGTGGANATGGTDATGGTNATGGADPTGGTAGADATGGTGAGAGPTGGGGGVSNGGVAGTTANSGGAAGGTAMSGGGAGEGGAGAGGESAVGGSGAPANGGKGGAHSRGGAGRASGAGGKNPPPTPSGCNCSLPGGTDRGHSHTWLLGLVAGAALRRRRRGLSPSGKDPQSD